MVVGIEKLAGACGPLPTYVEQALDVRTRSQSAPGSVRRCSVNNSLILAVPPDVRTAAVSVRGAVMIDVVQECLGDHLHLVALHSGPARSEACLEGQVSNR